MIYNSKHFVVSLKLSPSGWSVTSKKDERYEIWLYLGKVISGSLHGFMLDLGPIHLIIGKV